MKKYTIIVKDDNSIFSDTIEIEDLANLVCLIESRFPNYKSLQISEVKQLIQTM